MKGNVKKLTELANVIRSKNAGPFEMTLDIMLKNREIYEKVKATGVLNKSLIARLYNVSEDKVLVFVYFDAANAVKATLVRPRMQASIGETDMHGCQQHSPLLSIEIPWNE